MKHTILYCCIITALLVLDGCYRPIEKTADGVIMRLQQSDKKDAKLLRLQVCTERVIRVTTTANWSFSKKKSLIAVKDKWEPVKWWFTSNKDEAVLGTSKLKVTVKLSTGEVAFFDSLGTSILKEKAGGGKTFDKALVQGERTYHVRQEFEPNKDEALYGFGQHQYGIMNYKGWDVDLWQINSVVSLPVMVSNKGYGILWDNTSHTLVGDTTEPSLIPSACLYDESGKFGGLTGHYFVGMNFSKEVGSRKDSAINFFFIGKTPAYPDITKGGHSIRWQGYLKATTTGEYLFSAYHGSIMKMWLDDKLVLEKESSWLVWKTITKLNLDAGKTYRLTIEYQSAEYPDRIKLSWKTPEHNNYPYTSWWSNVGDDIDYYFMYGPTTDEVIAGYRDISGCAPIMPKWALGMWQSRNRYKTSDEILGVAKENRTRKIPFDNIVQDYHYWKPGTQGSHEFDKDRFPNLDSMINELHNTYKTKLMISVWTRYDDGTANCEAFKKRKGIFFEKPSIFGDKKNYYHLDVYNPDTRKAFWDQINHHLYSKGIDAWWLDATEPGVIFNESARDIEPEQLAGELADAINPTALGSGARYLNAYALMASRTFYEGQRSVNPNQRVYILTRSAFPGLQRYSASTWSGDIQNTWKTFKIQIPAGLNFCLAGIPYWTTDIGGHIMSYQFINDTTPKAKEEWRELMVRWFQYGTFCPIFRNHAYYTNEIYNIVPPEHKAYKAMLKFDRLRYRMMPYIYSLAAKVCFDNYTIMRGLVFDFQNDTNVVNIGDQFMFGPSLLVNPVTDYQATRRSLYLPKNQGGWYDMWTGKYFNSAQTILAQTPIDEIPLYVQAGSIMPFGPEIQYTAEKLANPITFFVYAGANGKFDLYEDEETNYNYTQGAYSVIQITYNDSAKKLVFSQRKGEFPGMLKSRTFHVVFVEKGRPVKLSFDLQPTITINYDGNEQARNLRDK